MRRHLGTTLLVLVPFALMVAYGFSLLKDPAPISLPEAPARPIPTAPPIPDPSPSPTVAAPAAPPLASPTKLPAPKPEPTPAAPPKPVADLSAVEPLVQQCFADVIDRVRDSMQVTVVFSTTLEGKFEGISVKKTSWQDPHLTACITDAFEESHFAPTGTALHRQSYTFSFAVPDGGR